MAPPEPLERKVKPIFLSFTVDSTDYYYYFGSANGYGWILTHLGWDESERILGCISAQSHCGFGSHQHAGEKWGGSFAQAISSCVDSGNTKGWRLATGVLFPAVPPKRDQIAPPAAVWSDPARLVHRTGLKNQILAENERAAVSL